MFNVGERVQGFTHPLWTLLLCLGPPEYLCQYAVALGVLFTLASLVVVGAIFRRLHLGCLGFIAFCMVFFSSKSALEWSTSGVENSLTHACLAVALAAGFRQEGGAKPVFAVALGFGLLVFNRLDQCFLALPVVVYVGWLAMRTGFARRFVKHVAVGLTPIALWFMFASVYYGYPLPNTSYAKLGGWTLDDRIPNGLGYLLDFARYEPWHAGVVALLMLLAPALLRCASSSGARVVACAGLGIALQCAYIVYVGGDYMRGRFMTGSLLVAAVGTGWLTQAFWAGHPRCATVTSLACVGLLSVATAVGRSEPAFSGGTGVARISAAYDRDLSSLTLSRIRASHVSHASVFEQLRRYNEMNKSNYPIEFGALDQAYGLARSVPLIDHWGLVDPFVARCRPSPRNRTGHVQRNIPLAYLEARGCINAQPGWRQRLQQRDPSLSRDVEQARKRVRWLRPAAKKAYDELTILTRGPIFARNRWPLVLKYTFTRPLAFDPHDERPAIIGPEVTPQMATVSEALGDTVVLVGIEPSQYDYYGPRKTGGFWLGPGRPGRVEVVVDSRINQSVLLSFAVVNFGRACPQADRCDLDVSAGERPGHRLRIGSVGPRLVRVSLQAGRQAITLTIPHGAGPHRFYMDPRPLMLYVTDVRIEPNPVT